MPFTSTLAIGLIIMIVGGLLLALKKERKVAIGLLIAGFVILIASFVLINVAVESMS